MRQYPDQPDEIAGIDVGYLKDTLSEIISESLPDCATNDWFIESVNFPNMIDKIVEEIQRG